MSFRRLAVQQSALCFQRPSSLGRSFVAEKQNALFNRKHYDFPLKWGNEIDEKLRKSTKIPWDVYACHAIVNVLMFAEFLHYARIVIFSNFLDIIYYSLLNLGN